MPKQRERNGRKERRKKITNKQQRIKKREIMKN